jgi:hypothetical protein
MQRVLASWGESCRLASSRFWERYVIKDKLIDGILELTWKICFQIFTIAVILLWIVVSVRTAIGAISGKVFFAPCVADLNARNEDEKDRSKQV